MGKDWKQHGSKSTSAVSGNKGAVKALGTKKPEGAKRFDAKNAGKTRPGKPPMKTLGDALATKKSFTPAVAKPKTASSWSDKKGASGAKKSNDGYKKGWAKSAAKYSAGKKGDDTEANFKKAGSSYSSSSGGPTGENDNNKKRQKELKIERSQSKPNFKLVEVLKSSWNKVRVKSTPEKERQQLLVTMANQMAGHVLQVTLRHDASRITQCLLQFGTAQQKQQVLQELLAKAFEISKTPYGHFTILKAISYCTSPEDQKRIAHAFQGHFVALGTNVIGARTVESICSLYPPKLTRPLRAEFFGSKFIVLLEEPPASLDQLLEHSVTQPKRAMILDHMRDLVQKFVDKGLLEFKYVHELIWEYCRALSGGPADGKGEISTGDAKRMEDLSNQLLDSAPKLMATKAGARVVCVIASLGGAKERKRLLKVSQKIKCVAFLRLRVCLMSARSMMTKAVSVPARGAQSLDEEPYMHHYLRPSLLTCALACVAYLLFVPELLLS
jgi:hypothetical protein